MRRKWDDECKWALANNLSSHVRTAWSSSLTLQWELAVILIWTQAGLWEHVPSSIWLPESAFRRAMRCPDSADAWNSTVPITYLCQFKKPTRVISHWPSKSRGGETDLSLRHRQPGSLGVSQLDQPHVQLSHHLGNQGHTGHCSAGHHRTSQISPSSPTGSLHLHLLCWRPALDTSCPQKLWLFQGGDNRSSVVSRIVQVKFINRGFWIFCYFNLSWGVQC